MDYSAILYIENRKAIFLMKISAFLHTGWLSHFDSDFDFLEFKIYLNDKFLYMTIELIISFWSYYLNFLSE